MSFSVPSAQAPSPAPRGSSDRFLSESRGPVVAAAGVIVVVEVDKIKAAALEVSGECCRDERKVDSKNLRLPLGGTHGDRIDLNCICVGQRKRRPTGEIRSRYSNDVDEPDASSYADPAVDDGSNRSR